MIVRLKEKNPEFADLTPDQPYFVIGIEANDFRILNDSGKPYLYPSDLFEIVDSHEPSIWVTEYGDEGERYSYPPELKEAGFFEDYFDGREDARSTFWHVVNKRLSEAA
jgi:hypothetical protein